MVFLGCQTSDFLGVLIVEFGYLGLQGLRVKGVLQDTHLRLFRSFDRFV